MKICANIPMDKATCYQIYLALMPHAHLYTKAALELVATNEFRYTKGLNRGHIIGRADTWEQLRSRVHTEDEFWEIYHDNDRVIMMTSSENNIGHHSRVYPVPPGYFLSTGYAFKHNNKERDLLRQLYSNINQP